MSLDPPSEQHSESSQTKTQDSVSELPDILAINQGVDPPLQLLTSPPSAEASPGSRSLGRMLIGLVFFAGLGGSILFATHVIMPANSIDDGLEWLKRRDRQQRRLKRQRQYGEPLEDGITKSG